MIPIALGTECQRVMPPKDIPCSIISSWKPVSGCIGNMSVYSDNGELQQTMEWTDSIPFCNITFNITTTGTYIYNSTIENGIIAVQAEDNMTSLGVILFLMLLNGAVFYIPFKVQFSQNQPTDYVMKNITWVLGWGLLTFNTTILATLADNAGLGITHELFVFQWFFLKGIYVLMLIIVLKTMLLVPKLLREQKDAKRMGKDEG